MNSSQVGTFCSLLFYNILLTVNTASTYPLPLRYKHFSSRTISSVYSFNLFFKIFALSTVIHIYFSIQTHYQSYFPVLCYLFGFPYTLSRASSLSFSIFYSYLNNCIDTVSNPELFLFFVFITAFIYFSDLFCVLICVIVHYSFPCFIHWLFLYSIIPGVFSYQI